MERPVDVERIQETVTRIRKNVQRVIVGKDEAINHAIMALLCRGHILVEDVPGIGKTTLSKVLAQRLGAPLPTLFIDEGFGTQDTVGRERILDVINSIGEDFEKVLVITHFDDLKDGFEVRINVLKDESGSTIWID